MILKWSYCTSEEIARLNKGKTLVVLPIAATEQHGAHLPLGTDTIILDSLLDRFRETASFPEHTILIAPTISVGKSNEHMDFAGTLSFSSKTLYNMLFDLCTSICRHGFSKILMMNSHGGNTDLINLVSRDLRIELGAEIYVFDWWFTSFWNEILEEIQESGEYGVFHACELETSLMLELFPQGVDLSKAVDETPKQELAQGFVTIKGPVSFGWKTKDLSEKGVIGTPTLASAEKGKRLVNYAVQKFEQIVSEILQKSYKQ